MNISIKSLKIQGTPLKVWKVCNSQSLGGLLWISVFWTPEGRCSQDLPTAAITCTKSRQSILVCAKERAQETPTPVWGATASCWLPRELFFSKGVAFGNANAPVDDPTPVQVSAALTGLSRLKLKKTNQLTKTPHEAGREGPGGVDLIKIYCIHAWNS